MAYEPTTWKSGDVVTSAKLNKLESGVAEAGSGGGILFVGAEIEGDTATLDKTYKEITDAGFAVLVMPGDTEGFTDVLALSGYGFHEDDNEGLVTFTGDYTLAFMSTGENGYPTCNLGGGGGPDVQ